MRRQLTFWLCARLLSDRPTFAEKLEINFKCRCEPVYKLTLFCRIAISLNKQCLPVDSSQSIKRESNHKNKSTAAFLVCWSRCQRPQKRVRHESSINFTFYLLPCSKRNCCILMTSQARNNTLTLHHSLYTVARLSL